MTEEQCKVIAELRHEGYAVIVWSPKELRNVKPDRVEDRLIELGWEIIEDMR